MATTVSSNAAEVLDLQADFLETQSSLVQDLANDIHQAASVLGYKTYDLDAEATSLRKEAWQARRSVEEMKTTIKKEGGQAKNGRQMSELLIRASETMDRAQGVKSTLQALIKVVCGSGSDSELAVSSWRMHSNGSSNNSALTTSTFKHQDDEKIRVKDTDTDTDKLELELKRHALHGSSNHRSRKVTRLSALGSIAKPSSSVAHIAGTATGTVSRASSRGHFVDLKRSRDRNKNRNRSANRFVAVNHVWGSDICGDNQIGSDGHGHSHSHGHGLDIGKNHSLISHQLATKPKPWTKQKAKEVLGPKCTALTSGPADSYYSTSVCLEPACHEFEKKGAHQAALFKDMVVCNCEKCASPSHDHSEWFHRPDTDLSGDGEGDGHSLSTGEELADEGGFVPDEDDTEEQSEDEVEGEVEVEVEAEAEDDNADCEEDGDGDQHRQDSQALTDSGSNFLSWIPDKVTISRRHVQSAAESLYQSVLMGEQNRLMRERVGG
ncbi:hypothetical protein HRR83_005558 [Exophiala dermatitidis]|uniref:Uncharacterized protein n=1 Tax=Exophiala dermatitidis TaxID=5970 RepID=A0AAN6IRV3_EXODE|nr:hypothetical protein HRR75_008443 [Exophiala dermatitidis]KAJ4503789.1 hypothetical protein HRR74_009180 [Exophiala dermatitidis]KAJ4508170.1 hypothetical protein HRR73_007609 [Exophiala dermatitidis]KAJ4531906.1 hypothetical protein HRR77_009037 [Exophiala dermatitidis]KAJ4537878.1 hypothetical protein HRR78_008470 [Exophiala dermatitidis]